MLTRKIDEPVGTFIQALILPEDWLEAVLERISLRDEVARVRAEREQLHTKLRKLGTAYADHLIDEGDCQRQKARYEFELSSLVVPEADAVAEAGRSSRCLWPRMTTSLGLAAWSLLNRH